MCSIQIERKSQAMQANGIINLAEVRLFNRANNQIPASQLLVALSSTHSVFAVQNCFDGNPGTICHSLNWDSGDSDPKLLVRYPCSEELSRVEVVNRQDCCRERIADFQMRFLDASGAVLRQTFQFTGGESAYTVIPQGKRARAVW